MDLHPTPFPVRSRTMDRKTTRIMEVQKTDAKGRGLPPREKPVFGTVRNPNIPPRSLKTAFEKPVKGKPTTGLLRKATKPSQAIRSLPSIRAPILETKKLSEKTPARPKKKSVCFQEKEVKRNGKSPDYEDASEPHTPLTAVIAKPRIATPYHTAEKCSKCRFDKLEAASYWLSQINLAESVGRHSVSAAFFKLAFECSAEPIRNLRVALKKYLGRHDHLNEGVEWRKVTVSYGLVKEKSCMKGEDVKAVVEEANASVHTQNDKDLPNKIAEESIS